MKAFYIGAEWCGQCKMWRPTFEQKCKDIEMDYEIVDADKDDALCSKFGVRNIPFVIVLDEQDEVVLKGMAMDIIPLI